MNFLSNASDNTFSFFRQTFNESSIRVFKFKTFMINFIYVVYHHIFKHFYQNFHLCVSLVPMSSINVVSVYERKKNFLSALVCIYMYTLGIYIYILSRFSVFLEV